MFLFDFQTAVTIRLIEAGVRRSDICETMKNDSMGDEFKVRVKVNNRREVSHV